MLYPMRSHKASSPHPARRPYHRRFVRSTHPAVGIRIVNQLHCKRQKNSIGQRCRTKRRPQPQHRLSIVTYSLSPPAVFLPTQQLLPKRVPPHYRLIVCSTLRSEMRNQYRKISKSYHSHSTATCQHDCSNLTPPHTHRCVAGKSKWLVQRPMRTAKNRPPTPTISNIDDHTTTRYSMLPSRQQRRQRRPPQRQRSRQRQFRLPTVSHASCPNFTIAITTTSSDGCRHRHRRTTKCRHPLRHVRINSKR